jgi:hydrogenase maturation protease
MLTSERPTGTRTVVIGLGNPLMGDDGLGLIALAQLQAEWHVPEEIELVDGGTWGMTLLPVIEGAARLLLLDAIETGAPPGTLHVLERNRIPRYLATKISPHQVDLHDVLALAELRGTFPAEAVAIGLQPTRIEFGNGLSDVVACRVDELVRAVVIQLERWGHVCELRAGAAVHHA